MPVHRPALKDRSAVVAFSDELDRWISPISLDPRDADAADNDQVMSDAENKEALVRAHENVSSLAGIRRNSRRKHDALQDNSGDHSRFTGTGSHRECAPALPRCQAAVWVLC